MDNIQQSKLLKWMINFKFNVYVFKILTTILNLKNKSSVVDVLFWLEYTVCIYVWFIHLIMPIIGYHPYGVIFLIVEFTEFV
jgi:hypothetical protein